MVYVDDFEQLWRGMIMSHMIADSTEELLEMASKIGVQHRWIQDAGTPREHFDICLSKKMLATQYGAKPIGMRELTAITSSRATPPKCKPQNDFL